MSHSLRFAAVVVILATAFVCGAATYTVSVNIDNVASPPAGSLREAINLANSNPGADAIAFAIGSGAKSITLAGALPAIIQPLDLDATTQPGYEPAKIPIIELNASGVGATAVINLAAGSDGSSVRGFVINRFPYVGVNIASTNGHTIKGNWFNVNAAGNAVSHTAGSFASIYVQNGTGVQIGGTTAAERNVLCASQYGIALWWAACTANSVTGNWIGLLPNGSAGTGPSFDCVSIANGSHHQAIGGTAVGAGNVLSNATRWGVAIHDGTGGNTVQGNLIGTNATGDADFGNDIGCYIAGAAGNTIGGSTSSARNIISGNNGSGIYLDTGATTNTIQSNYIGLRADGTAAIANGVGIEVTQPGQIIGGVGTGNVISGNSGAGINLGTNSLWSVVQGNIIGLNPGGNAVRPNGAEGVNLNGSYVRLGGTAAGEGNVISGNTGKGLIIQNATCTSNTVEGNYIGLDATGTADLGNGNDGVWIVNSTKYNTIGGSAPGARNVISGNTRGMLVYSSSGPNYIQNNLIGWNAAGNGLVPNSAEGIYCGNSAIAMIGGETAGLGNRIAGNSIGVYRLDASNIQVLGNSIRDNTGLGIDAGATGMTANDGSGEADGVQNYPVIYTVSNGASEVTIGGSLVTTPNTTCRLEFFRNPSSCTEEGADFLGSSVVTSNGSGNAAFSAVFAATVSNGEYITATATTSARGTSEFCQARPAPYNYLVVTNTNDSGAGSLRQCIADANSTFGPNTITFNIPGAGIKRIILASQLTVLDPVTIDGTSQPGYSWTPIIELNGWGSDIAGISVATLASSGSTIRGLSITGFRTAGLVLWNSNNNIVAGNWLGVDATGTSAPGNGLTPSATNLYIENGASNVIGGTTAADRNVICGGHHCVGIWYGLSTNNTVMGNWIGMRPDGATAASPVNDCVNVWYGAHHNTIGGTTSGSGNVLAYAGRWGIGLGTIGAAGGNIVQGNKIGADATGMLDYGNGLRGVSIDSNPNNLIGGNSAAARNIISGNNGSAIVIAGAGATTNTIQGNYIGLNAAGAAALSNTGRGIYANQPGQIIGGSAAGEGNVISGNSSAGVCLESGADNCIIRGNIIGLNSTASAPVPNNNGIEATTAGLNMIGGLNPSDRNIVSGNNSYGILLSSNATSNTILGNLIGLDGAGAADMGNGADGIRLTTGASWNVIGSSAPAGRNFISGNNGNGILVMTTATLSNTIAGNSIGTAADGTTLVGNSASGVSLSNVVSMVVGGAAAGEGNLIAGNATGVRAADTTGVRILGNVIRSNAGLGIDAGQAGITPSDPLDADAVQNAPIITLVGNGASETTVTGTLSSSPSTTFRLEFFSNSAPDPSGSGEGERWLGAANVTTNEAGLATFDISLPAVTAATDYVSATATSMVRGTSEFSAALHCPVSVSVFEIE